MNEQLPAKRILNFVPDLTNGQSEEGETVDSRPSSVKATQSNGLVLASVLPADANSSCPIVENVIFATLDWADLKAGKSFLDIRHQRKPEDRRKPYYSTSITNRSSERVRIDRFGTYIQKGQTLVLHSITGGFLSSQQFQEWYELGNEWLEPGQVVTDPNNHSQVGVYWAYFGTTASGKQFVTGATWNGKRWWQ
jgi:hypothetical protein